MIDLFSKGNHNLSPKEKHELATAFTGLSGANIEEIILKAIRNAVINESQVSKADFYNELFSFKDVTPQNCSSEKVILKAKAKFLRECNDKVFSLQVIADILGSSKTTISKLVKEADE